jgi:hypothetical protein
LSWWPAAVAAAARVGLATVEREVTQEAGMVGVLGEVKGVALSKLEAAPPLGLTASFFLNMIRVAEAGEGTSEALVECCKQSPKADIPNTEVEEVVGPDT